MLELFTGKLTYAGRGRRAGEPSVRINSYVASLSKHAFDLLGHPDAVLAYADLSTGQIAFQSASRENDLALAVNHKNRTMACRSLFLHLGLTDGAFVALQWEDERKWLHGTIRSANAGEPLESGENRKAEGGKKY